MPRMISLKTDSKFSPSTYLSIYSVPVMTHFHLSSLLIVVILLSVSSGAPQNVHLLSSQDLVDPNVSDVIPSPLLPDPSSSSSSLAQVIPQQDIQIGSQTDVNPITGVYPNVIYQPNIQLYNPLVSTYQSETPYDYYGNDYGNDYGYGDYPDDMLPLTSGPGIAINKRQAPIIPGDSLVGPLDALNDITTNTLIKPIISIQPHALKPVPVPVSRPYTVPVPIGIPASWRGEWYDDCDGYDSHGWDDDCDGYDDHDWDDDCDE